MSKNKSIKYCIIHCICVRIVNTKYYHHWVGVSDLIEMEMKAIISKLIQPVRPQRAYDANPVKLSGLCI